MRESNWGVTLLIVVLVVLLVASAAWNGFLYAKVGAVRDSVSDVRDEMNTMRADVGDMEKRVDAHDRALRELGRAAEDIQFEEEGKTTVEEILRFLSRVARILL